MMGDGIFSRYWHAYGGVKSLVKSVYFWGALVLTAVLYPLWSTGGWWNDVLSIMPSLLGFSLGGYAMWTAVGDDDFRRLISGPEKDGSPSPYMKMNAAFVHFIVLQFVSIVLALIAKAYDFEVPPEYFLRRLFGQWFYDVCLLGSFIGYFVFVYALLTALAATFAVFRASSWYDKDTETRRKGD